MSEDAATEDVALKPHTVRFVLLLCAIFGVSVAATAWGEHVARTYRREHSGTSFTYERDSPILNPPLYAGSVGLGAIGLFVIIEVVLRRWSAAWLLSLLAVAAAFFCLAIELSQTAERYYL